MSSTKNALLSSSSSSSTSGRSYRRRRWRLLCLPLPLPLRFRWRTLRLVALVFVLVNLLDVLRVQGNLARCDGRRGASHLLSSSSSTTSTSSSSSQKPQRIYIASMHFNSADLLRNHWSAALLSLAEALGPANIFVHIFESGSWDDTKMLLTRLDADLARLGVARRVEMSNRTHADEMHDASAVSDQGWIATPRGTRELRRVPYLARLRNRTLRDLVDLNARGVTFDKVLFLNDVVFTTDDVLTLLHTNAGRYAGACSLDFSKPPLYYDTFALRDRAGHAHVMQTWPYFGDRRSRDALVAHADAVPVSSCWNGIVIMPAEPFVSAQTPLRFRGLPDSLARHHLEASECCLIHADNPLSPTLGVFLNPRVRVGYDMAAYAATHPSFSWSGSGSGFGQGGGHGAWVSAWHILAGRWTNRLRRWDPRPALARFRVRHRVARWERRQRPAHKEVGEFCIINEMQVLAENGWAHV